MVWAQTLRTSHQRLDLTPCRRRIERRRTLRRARTPDEIVMVANRLSRTHSEQVAMTDEDGVLRRAKRLLPHRILSRGNDAPGGSRFRLAGR